MSLRERFYASGACTKDNRGARELRKFTQFPLRGTPPNGGEMLENTSPWQYAAGLPSSRADPSNTVTPNDVTQTAPCTTDLSYGNRKRYGSPMIPPDRVDDFGPMQMVELRRMVAGVASHRPWENFSAGFERFACKVFSPPSVGGLSRLDGRFSVDCRAR